MIAVTRLDGERVFLNERNIQWVESLPDTAVTFLGGARLLIREDVHTLMSLIEQASRDGTTLPSSHADESPSASGYGARAENESTP